MPGGRAASPGLAHRVEHQLLPRRGVHDRAERLRRWRRSGISARRYRFEVAIRANARFRLASIAASLTAHDESTLEPGKVSEQELLVAGVRGILQNDDAGLALTGQLLDQRMQITGLRGPSGERQLAGRGLEQPSVLLRSGFADRQPVNPRDRVQSPACGRRRGSGQR